MSWKKVKLGELVTNFSVRAKDVGGAEGLDFYGVSNEEGIIKTKYAAEDKAEDYKIIEKDCFAYNPYRVNVGSIGLVADDTRGLISPAYVVFKPKPNSIKADLLLKFLKSTEGLRQIKFYARGTVRQALRFEDLCNIELSIPSFEEQEILINILNNTEVESNILKTELTHQLTLVKKLRQQLLQDAVQGKLLAKANMDSDFICPPDKSGGDSKHQLPLASASGLKEKNAISFSQIETGHQLLQKIKAEKEKLIAEKKLKKEKELPPIKPEEIPFEIPDNWVWCRLGEIVNLVTSGSRDWAKYYSSEGEVFVRMGNLSRDSYNLRMDKIQYVKPPKNQEGNRTRLEADDILISITGEVGNLGLIPKDFGEAYINQHTALVRLNKEIVVKYVCNLFLSRTLQEQFNAPQRGMKNSFRLSDIDYLLIPLPPLAEQNRIVQKLDELMQYCNELEASIKQSESQNEKLLQQVLREALRKEPVEV
jgi:type I restriction enzyme S subunit